MTKETGKLPASPMASVAHSLIPQGPVDPESVDRIKDFWMGSPQRLALCEAPIFQINSDEMAAQAELAFQRMTKPASGKWVAGRVATMMVQYFTAALPPEVQAVIASDWLAEMTGKKLPGWAIQKAVRWWMGAENPKRDKRPMPGDISARALHEMEFVRNLAAAVEIYHRRKSIAIHPHKTRETITEESKARVDALVKSMFRAPGAAAQGDDE